MSIKLVKCNDIIKYSRNEMRILRTLPKTNLLGELTLNNVLEHSVITVIIECLTECDTIAEYQSKIVQIPDGESPNFCLFDVYSVERIIFSFSIDSSEVKYSNLQEYESLDNWRNVISHCRQRKFVFEDQCPRIISDTRYIVSLNGIQ